MEENTQAHKIIHITDLHCEAATSQKLMTRATRLINVEKPDIIICTGDFVMRDELSIMERNHRIAEEFIKSLSCKQFYQVPGNHDCYDSNRDSALHLYEKTWGEERFSANLEGLFIIGVNSNITNETVKKVHISAGTVRDEAVKFMEKEILDADKNDFRIFCVHHHLIPMYNDTYGNAFNVDMLWNAGKILRILRRNRFDLVLQGHKHDPEIFILDDTVYLVGGALLRKVPDHVENTFYSIEVGELVTIKLHLLQSERQKIIYCAPNKRYVPTSILPDDLNMGVVL